MFILPISHEDMTARRWPWVTTSLILLCFGLHLALDTETAEREFDQAAQRAVAHYQEHPELRPPPLLERVLGDAPAELRAPPGAPPDGFPPELLIGAGPPDDADAEAETEEEREAARAVAQAELDRLTADMQAAIDTHPTRRLGFIPAEPRALGLITHQFVHGGWLHLLSNLWFLWLCGCNLEDRWGRAVFGAFYVLAGVAAGGAHWLLTGAPEAALVGASGAIAGAIGGFLVLHARTRIRFFYFWPFAFRFGTFQSPAFVMLPLWALSELLNASVEAESGVAHWAHVGGFAFGLPVALLLRYTGVEARLDAAVDEAVTTRQDPRILEAAAHVDGGRFAEAFALLDALVRQQPRSIDAHMELLRAALAAGDDARALTAYDRLIPLQLDHDAEEAAVTLWREVLEAQATRSEAGSPGTSQLPRPRRLKLGQALAARGEWLLAGRTLQGVYAGGLVDGLAVRAAVENADVALRAARPEAALRLLREAAASPHLERELGPRLTELRAQAETALARVQPVDAGVPSPPEAADDLGRFAGGPGSPPDAPDEAPRARDAPDDGTAA